MQFDAPIVAPSESVRPEWIDHNGHLNMAYYNVFFDHGIDHLFEQIGCGPAYVKNRGMGTFTVAAQVRYLRELKVHSSVSVATRLLEHDDKRLRFFQELHHEDGWLSATSEVLILHIDMSGPKATPFPPDILERIIALHAAHAGLPVPEAAGQGITLKPRPKDAP